MMMRFQGYSRLILVVGARDHRASFAFFCLADHLLDATLSLANWSNLPKHASTAADDARLCWLSGTGACYPRTNLPHRFTGEK